MGQCVFRAQLRLRIFCFSGVVKTRKKLFSLIEIGSDSNEESSSFDFYDWFMMAVILLSIIPLAFHSHNKAFDIIDKVTVTIFIIDYILRVFTADLKLNKGAKSFFLYPFTPMAILDLITILPSLTVLSNGFRLLKIFRLLRTFKAFRAFKVIRYSKSINLILDVFKAQSKTLGTVAGIATGYVLFSALLVFNVEPESFNKFFDAIYWATVSLTTVGYGDIYPTSTIGRIVTMISSIFGIAIVALPAGIITAGFMEALNEKESNKEKRNEIRDEKTVNKEIAQGSHDGEIQKES
ncbi:MAG: ion transporter [Clostridia bacterium]|nr:ion transporter [Clostridia bacterium]